MDGSKDFPGILDTKWKSENIFWTCERDGLRRWDLGTNHCKCPDVLCFDYDNYCTAITGGIYGKIMVWDARKNTPVEINRSTDYLENDIFSSYITDRGPVYSLAFGATDLYMATNSHYFVYDFRL